MRIFTALSLIALASVSNSGGLHSVSNTKPPESPLRMPVLSKTTPLGMPAFSSEGNTLCDTEGNLYFEAVNPGVPEIDKGLFIRVSADGKQHTVYLLSDKSGSGTPLDAVFQAVSPGGSFYLVGRSESASVLIHYKSDGTVAGEHKLSLPEKAFPQMIAAADSGVIYVSGYLETGPADQFKKSFAGLYASDGTRIADLSKGLKDFESSTLARPEEEAVIAAQDGLFYVLQSGKVAILNESGVLEQTLNFEKPDASWSAVGLDISTGLAAVRFVAPEPQANGVTYLSTRLLLLDVQTGETRGWYAFDPGTPSSVLCFSRQDGLSVYGVEKGQAVRKWYALQ